MNRNAFKRLFIFIITGMVVWPFLWYGYKFYWQNTTQKLYRKAENTYAKRYAYVEFRGKLRQVIYGTSLEEGQQLRKYYDQKKTFYKELKEGKRTWDKEVIDGDTTLSTGIHIPNSVDIRFIGVQKPIYIKANKDSVANILVFDTTCWGYYEAYLPQFVIHDTPPEDTLFNKFKKKVESLPESNPHYGKPSPYGIYCN